VTKVRTWVGLDVRAAKVVACRTIACERRTAAASVVSLVSIA
jgi:hypothetical protein